MPYDKKSFLAGIAVGRQLKGWATGGSDGDPGPGPDPPIPEEYTPVEYIYTSGGAFLNTLYLVKRDTRIEASVKVLQTSNTWPCIFGMRDASDKDTSVAFFYQWSNGTNQLNARWSSNDTTITKNIKGIDIKIVQSIEYAAVYDTTGAVLATISYSAYSTGSGVSAAPLWIFCLNSGSPSSWGSGIFAVGYIYSFQIYESFTLVHNYIPVMYLSVAGLYDTVSKVFLQSGSATPFTAGPVVGGG